MPVVPDPGRGAVVPEPVPVPVVPVPVPGLPTPVVPVPLPAGAHGSTLTPLFLVVGLAVEDPRCAPVAEPVVEPDVPTPDVELDLSPLRAVVEFRSEPVL